jgi:hypothetical protein
MSTDLLARPQTSLPDQELLRQVDPGEARIAPVLGVRIW